MFIDYASCLRCTWSSLQGPEMSFLICVASLLFYSVLARALRYQRRDTLSRRYSKYIVSPEALGQMSLHDAFDIQLTLAELEFPRTFSVSIFFALFKTFAIPSISATLAGTGQWSNLNTASKRAADTGVLLTEFILHRPGSERNLDGIARMNYFHDLYRKSGKIKDDDMLYTLSLFALEPIRWTKMLEWRDLNDLELCAMAVYWRNMGDVMGISYERLPSSDDGWVNALEWLRELQTWSDHYEVEHMVPNPNNKLIAETTIEIGLMNLPSLLKPLGRQFAASLLNERLRRAMLFEDPPAWIQGALDLGIILRKMFIRYLMPPRPSSMRPVWFTSQPDPLTGNYHAEQYIGHPWYVHPRKRWSLNSWLLWFVGGHIPSAGKTEYRPEGYKIAELGPKQFEGKGMKEMEAAKHAIARMQGCPFHVKGSS